MTSLPPGVERFDKTIAQQMAARNIIMSLYGDSKSGKTHFAVRCGRPLYIAYLDPNSALDYHLLKAEQDGYVGDIFKCVVPPVSYDQLTGPKAHEIVGKVDAFAAWARREAKAREDKGEPGGTFVVDGMTMFKGYVEKDILGESATLGWRATKGERGGPSTFDYAKSNGALRDFVSGFMGSSCDVVLVWEGRPEYANGEPIPGKFHSTMPTQVPFAVTVEAEVFVELEPIIENSVRTGSKPVPKVRVARNTYGLELRDRAFPAKGFDGLKRLLLAGLDA